MNESIEDCPASKSASWLITTALCARRQEMQCFNPQASLGHASSNSFSVLPWHSDPAGGGAFAGDFADSPESNLKRRAADRQKLLLGYEQGIGDSSEPAAFSFMLARGSIKALAPASHLGGGYGNASSGH